MKTFARLRQLPARLVWEMVDPVIPERRTWKWRNAELSALWRDGPEPIVFLHGLCGGAVHFDRAFGAQELLGRGLVAIDLPGFGLSSAVRSESCGIEGAVAAVSEVLDELAPVQPWFVAHSLSSSVAGRLLDRAAGLVLLEGNLLASHLDFSDRLLAFSVDTFAEEYSRIRRGSELMLRLKSKVPTRKERARYAETFAQCSAEAVRIAAAEGNVDTRAGNQREILRRWSGPAYYYCGEDGDADEAEVRSCGTGVTVRTIPRASHFLMFDNAQETYSMIAADAVPNASEQM